MGVAEDAVDLAPQLAVAGAGREHAEEVTDRRDHVRLVDRAGAAQHRCQFAGGTLAEGGEAIGRPRFGPAARRRDPARRREVVERDDGIEAGGEQRLALAAVVVDGGGRPLALLGLDAAPLEGEPVVGQSEIGAEGDVLGPPVPRVAGVARRLDGARALGVLPRPPVVVPVAALDLVGGGRRPPSEPVGEGVRPCRGEGSGPRWRSWPSRPTPSGTAGRPSTRRAVDDLVELLDLERLEDNLFRGVSPAVKLQRVFGGQVAGQALVAAARTVEPELDAPGPLAPRLLPPAR